MAELLLNTGSTIHDKEAVRDDGERREGRKYRGTGKE